MSEQQTNTSGEAQPTQPAVVLAVCDDAYGQAVAAAAVQYKWATDPVFHIVFVVDLDGLPTLAPQLVDEIEDDECKYGQELIGKLSAKLTAALPQAKVEGHIVNGPPVKEILDVADSTDAQMIIMGSHGRTGLKKIVLGSVSSQVVAHAKCSTLIIRLDRGQETTEIPGPPAITVADLPRKMVAYSNTDSNGN